MFQFRKKENLNQTKEIIYNLNKAILNEDIYRFIVNRIYSGIGSNKSDIIATERFFSCTEKKAKQGFSLTIEPSIYDIQKITAYDVLWDGRKTDIKEISFIDKNTISVIDIEQSTITRDSNIICSFEKKVNEKIYVNNLLTYEKEKSFQTYGSVENQNSRATETTTYVLDNRSAFTKEVRICEDNKFLAPTIRYLSTNRYNVPNYDTRITSNNKVLITHFKGIAAEEFYDAEKKVLNNIKQFVKK